MKSKEMAIEMIILKKIWDEIFICCICTVHFAAFASNLYDMTSGKWFIHGLSKAKFLG